MSAGKFGQGSRQESERGARDKRDDQVPAFEAIAKRDNQQKAACVSQLSDEADNTGR
jgi:hypothetical protein